MAYPLNCLERPPASGEPVSASHTVHSYRIHHLSLQIISHQPDIFNLLDQRFGVFRVVALPEDPLLRFYVCAPPSDVLPPDEWTPAWQIYHQTSELTAGLADSRLRFRYRDAGESLISLTDGWGSAYVRSSDSKHIRYRRCQDVLVPALFLLLSTQGLFPFHAAAVGWQNQGIVIAGASGQGKSTVLLHLLQAGMEYLADDGVLLREDTPVPRLYAFPGAIKCTPHTVSLLPDLHSMFTVTPPDISGKFRLYPLQNGHGAAAQAAPAMLLLPTVAADEETTLMPIDRVDAALHCIPENTLLSNTALSRRHFNVLAQLIQHTACYRVRLGKNMDSIGQQVRDVLRHLPTASRV